jgi:hypothetical protein
MLDLSTGTVVNDRVVNRRMGVNRLTTVDGDRFEPDCAIRQAVPKSEN